MVQTILSKLFSVLLTSGFLAMALDNVRKAPQLNGNRKVREIVAIRIIEFAPRG